MHQVREAHGVSERRGCAALGVGRSGMRELARLRGPSCAIQVDNGPEFVSKALDCWAYENGATLDFSRSGKPMDNALVDSFNGRQRDVCLNANWFLSRADARSKIET